ncbi:MAG TPA: FecR family protein [Steroidobacteraceae bacterium]|nr:FecR family protein [Steroidobacteraceae bacterium]
MNRPSDPSIETLIRLAGERDSPSATGMQRARAAAEQAWQDSLVRSRGGAVRRRWFAVLGFAAAAGLVAISFYSWRHENLPPAPVPVGHILAADAGAVLRHADVESPAVAAAPLYTGVTLATAQGRLAIAFDHALSLRLDRGTRLRFDGREQVTLLEGALYVDSGGINLASALRITTPAGEVRHVGTQFQVFVLGDTTRVRVREGRVLLEPTAGGSPQNLTTGDELEIRDGHARWRRGLPNFGPEWEWSSSVAAALDIENRPLAEYLAWLVREHGWQLRYTSEAVQHQAQQIRLHGSVEGLDVSATLERIVLVTGVPLALQDGVLWVGPPP